MCFSAPVHSVNLNDAYIWLYHCVKICCSDRNVWAAKLVWSLFVAPPPTSLACISEQKEDRLIAQWPPDNDVTQVLAMKVLLGRCRVVFLIFGTTRSFVESVYSASDLGISFKVLWDKASFYRYSVLVNKLLFRPLLQSSDLQYF